MESTRLMSTEKRRTSPDWQSLGPLKLSADNLGISKGLICRAHVSVQVCAVQLRSASRQTGKAWLNAMYCTDVCKYLRNIGSLLRVFNAIIKAIWANPLDAIKMMNRGISCLDFIGAPCSNSTPLFIFTCKHWLNSAAGSFRGGLPLLALHLDLLNVHKACGQIWLPKYQEVLSAVGEAKNEMLNKEFWVFHRVPLTTLGFNSWIWIFDNPLGLCKSVLV